MQQLGPRQQQILELLSEGSWSFLALLRRLNARGEAERKAVRDALHRLADRGLVRMNPHGKADMSGCMVELAEPKPAPQPRPQPKMDEMLARFLWPDASPGSR
jgi:hypothetical protein